MHWVNIAYTSDPSHPLAAAYYVAAGGAAESAVFAPYTSGQGHYNVIMAMVSFVFLLGSLRTNVPFVIVFFTLIILFGCIAGAEYELGYNPTAAGAEYAAKLLKVGGGFGFIAMIMGWYVVLLFFLPRWRLLFIFWFGRVWVLTRMSQVPGHHHGLCFNRRTMPVAHLRSVAEGLCAQQGSDRRARRVRPGERCPRSLEQRLRKSWCRCSVGFETGGEVKRSNFLEGAEWMGDLGGETLWGEGC